MNRSAARFLVCVLVCLPAAGALAADRGPASGPDIPRATDPQYAPLAKICQKLNQRQWGEAIVETFEKAPDKNVWKTTAGTLTVKHEDGDCKLMVKADANNMAVVHRGLPTSLKDSEAVRIEAWVQLKPMVFPGQQPAFCQFNNMMFVGTNPQALHQWEYMYNFAQGQNGIIHTFNANQFGFNRAVQAGEIKAGKLVHITLELAGRGFSCVRDGGKALSDTMTNAPPFKVTPEMGVGLMCYSASFSIVQMSYRGLVRDQRVFKPEDWNGSGFADQPDLTRHLARRVIPCLDDPRFSVRNAANEVLTALWPLSKPAVDAAAGKLATDEGLLRIKALQDCVPDIQIVKGQVETPVKAPTAKDLPADDQAKPVVKADKPKAATSQPAAPLKIRGGAVRAAPNQAPVAGD